MPGRLPKSSGPARDAYEAQYPTWTEREKRRGQNQPDEVWMKFEDEEGTERAMRIPRGDMDDDAWNALREWEAAEVSPAGEAETAIRQADQAAQAAAAAAELPDVGQKPKARPAAPRPRLTVGKPEIVSRTTQPWEDTDEVEAEVDGTKVKIPRGDMDDDAWKAVVLQVGKPKVLSREVGIDQHAVDQQSGTTSADSDEAVAASAAAVPQYGGTTSADSDEFASASTPAGTDDEGRARAALARDLTMARYSGGQVGSSQGGVPGLAGGFIADAMRDAAVKIGPVDPFAPTDPRVLGPAQPSQAAVAASSGPQPEIAFPPQASRIHNDPNYPGPAELQAQMDAIDRRQVVTSPVQPPPGAGSGSAAFKVGGVPHVPDATAGMEGALRKAYEAEAKAIEHAGQVEAKRLEETGKLQQKAAEEQMAGQQRLLAARQAHQEHLDQGAKAMDQTMAELKKVEQVDPNRLWNKMGTGNKIVAAVGMLLGNFGDAWRAAKFGTPMGPNQAMEMFDKAIQDDIALQREGIEARRGAKKDQLAQQRWAYDTLRQRGLDEYEAMKGEEVLKYQAALNMIEGVAAQMGSQEAIAKAQAAAAAFQPKIVQGMMAIRQHREQMGLEKAKLAMQQQALQIKAMAAANKGKAGEQLRGPQAAEIAALRQGLDQIKRLRKMRDGITLKAPKATGRVGQAALDLVTTPGRAAASAISGTDENRFNKAVNTTTTFLGKAADGSVLQKHDVERWTEQLGSAATPDGDYNLRLIEEEMTSALNHRLESYTRAGFDTAGYQGYAPGAANPADDGVEVDE